MRKRLISSTLIVCLVLTAFLTFQGIQHLRQQRPIQDVVYVGHKAQVHQWLETKAAIDKDQLLLDGAESEDLLSKVLLSQFQHSLIMTVSTAVLLLVQLLLALLIWLDRRSGNS